MRVLRKARERVGKHLKIQCSVHYVYACLTPETGVFTHLDSCSRRRNKWTGLALMGDRPLAPRLMRAWIAIEQLSWPRIVRDVLHIQPLF